MGRACDMRSSQKVRKKTRLGVPDPPQFVARAVFRHLDGVQPCQQPGVVSLSLLQVLKSQAKQGNTYSCHVRAPTRVRLGVLGHCYIDR
jgi:hypothetical protein